MARPKGFSEKLKLLVIALLLVFIGNFSDILLRKNISFVFSRGKKLIWSYWFNFFVLLFHLLLLGSTLLIDFHFNRHTGSHACHSLIWFDF